MKNRESYERRISRVVEFINDNLAEDISLNRLAEVACMSSYHWHRVYVGMRGETIAATVKRLRLQKASYLLVSTEISVENVAKHCGYANQQSFNRIFKSVYGLPPARYRTNGLHRVFDQQLDKKDMKMYKVSIKELEQMPIYTVDHVGPYISINMAFDKIFGWMGTRGLMNQNTAVMGLYYDDPDSIEPEKLRSKAAVKIDTVVDGDDMVKKSIVEAGRYAVVEFKGPYSEIHTAYRWLCGEWLLQSGEELASQPAVEFYLNDPSKTAPAELRTDIYLSLL